MDIADNAIERGVGDRRISDVIGVPALTVSCPTMMVAGWLATSPQLPSDSGNFTLAPPSATRV